MTESNKIQEELIKWLEHTIKWYEKQAKFWCGTKVGDIYMTNISATEYILKNIVKYPELTYHKTTDKSFIFGKRLGKRLGKRIKVY